MSLSEITGIKLQGANFERITQLQMLADGKEPSIGIIYGKNGAGKSTISKGFSKIRGDIEESIAFALPININGDEVPLTEEEKTRIHVFNENYVDKNIKFVQDEEGLGTIVVFGKDIVKEEEIETARESVRTTSELLEKERSNYSEYEDKKNPKSPEFYHDRMDAALRAQKGWAERSRVINEGRTAAKVYKETYLRFVKTKPAQSRDELIIEYEHKLSDLEKAKSKAGEIVEKATCKAVETLSFDERRLLAILKEKIEKPELNEREQFLLNILAENGRDHLNSVKYVANEPEFSFCPYCLQPITETYKNELKDSIKRALGEIAEDHVKNLSNLKIEPVEFDFGKYSSLNPEVVLRCQNSLDELNKCIHKVNESIQKKIDDVYTPVFFENCNVSQAISDVKNAFVALEVERIEYNKRISETGKLIEHLNNISDDIAYYDIIDDYICFQKQIQEKKTIKDKVSNLEEDLNSKTKALEALLTKEKDPKIALKQINHDLNYIFFANKRLSVRLENNRYIVESRGKSVPSNRLSVGERNAIALCYFFSEIMGGLYEGESYLNQHIIVVDDPVSSFDVENRIGILSFLNYQMKNYIIPNKTTQFVLLSHDLQTVYDLEKNCIEIVECTGVRNHKERHVLVQELNNQKLVDFNTIKKNDYTQLMVNTYLYAKGENDEYDLVIGNAMRRVLEAYGTFLYKRGISKFPITPEIVNRLEQPLADHFENFLFRLVLNGESHSEDRAKIMNSADFFDCITSEQKQRTAKELLVFLFSLDEQHVLSHLEKDLDSQQLVDVKADLLMWQNEIRSMCETLSDE